MEIMILGRQRDQLPSFTHGGLPRPEREADDGLRRIKAAHGTLGLWNDGAALIDFLVAESKRAIVGNILQTEKDPAPMSVRQRPAAGQQRCRPGAGDSCPKDA